MGEVKRNLPNDEFLAAINANSATALNPFATIADLAGGGGESLSATLTIGSTMLDGQTITSLNGGGYFSLGTATNNITLGNANGTFAKGWFFANDTDMQTGFGLVHYYEASATDLRLVTPVAATNYVSIDYFEVTVGARVAIASDNGPFRLFTTTGALTLAATPDNRGILMNNSGAVTITAGVDHSVAIGVSGGTVKTANTLYATQIGLINGSDAFESILTRAALTGDVTHTLPATGGAIALDGDWDSGATFIVSNDNTLRTIDANAINGNNFRDIFCTLLRDLNTAGVITI